MSSETTRERAIAAFLDHAGWGDAAQIWLGQDASTRRYARLQRGDDTAILMDAPAEDSAPCRPEMSEAARLAAGWNAQTRLAASRVDAFVLIAKHLKQAGLRPPEIFAYHSGQGLALLEDFGEGREFARLIERGQAGETELYRLAAQDLARLHMQEAPSRLKFEAEVWPILPFDALALRANANLFAEWLPQLEAGMSPKAADLARWERARDNLIARAEAFPRDFTLRDYHAENLLFLPEGQVAVLDFQDAVLGWDAWDMAMLTQDARRAVSADATDAAIRAYLDGTGKSETAFRERLAVIGALNALRITGVFARLQVRDRKPRYAQFMPRQQYLLAENLKHPAVADMAAFVRDVAPFIFEVAA
ncbi:MAG: phosphotransferase [Henriciella sp.]|nr:phosphotransferase [Henriciella sp.]